MHYHHIDSKDLHKTNVLAVVKVLLCPFSHFKLQKKRQAKVAQSYNKSAELIWSPVGSFWGNPPSSPLNSQTLDWLGFRLKALVLISWALLAQYVVFGVDLTAPQSKPVCHDEAGSLRPFQEVPKIVCHGQTFLLGQHALLLHRTAVSVAHVENKFCYRGWRCVVEFFSGRKFVHVACVDMCNAYYSLHVKNHWNIVTYSYLHIPTINT